MAISLEPNKFPLITFQSVPDMPLMVQVGFKTSIQEEGFPLITSLMLLELLVKVKLDPAQLKAGGLISKNGVGGSLTSIGSMVAADELHGLEAIIWISKALL